MRIKEKSKIIIEGGTILTMVVDKEPLCDASIVISGDTIEDICPRQHTSLTQAVELINAEGTIILPGLVNSHVHSPMTLFRGFADDLPLQQWLFDHIFPAEAKYITSTTVYWGSLLACVEMIASGTTTFADSYFFADDVIKAATDAGIRTIAAQGLIDFPGPGLPDPEKNVEAASCFLEKWLGFSDLITPGIFCHSPLTCSSETLTQASSVARRFGLPLQIHLSETQNEIVDIVKRTGLRPVFYMESLGLLDSDLIAVHAVHLDGKEIERLAERNVKVVHCPESNMKLGSGIAAVNAMMNRGVVVGLGTDGCASNNNLDLLREMDTAAKLAKISTCDPTTMDAKTVLSMATIGGARVMGMDHLIGTIQKGKKADIIIVDTKSPHMTPLYDPYSQIVYSAAGGDVRDVIVNGRILYRDRRFTELDVSLILKKVKRLSKEIKA